MTPQKEHAQITRVKSEENEPGDFKEAFEHFEELMEVFEEEIEKLETRQREGDSDNLWQDDIDHIQQILEADKEISLHESGHFHMELDAEALKRDSYKEPVHFMIPSQKFETVAVDVYMEEGRVSLQIKKKDR